MPIPVQNTATTPNYVYAPQIILQCAIVDGKLKTSAQIVLAGAHVTNAGQANEAWESTGQMKSLFIQDIENLDEDLSGYSSSILTVFGGIVALLGGLNSVRKLI